MVKQDCGERRFAEGLESFIADVEWGKSFRRPDVYRNADFRDGLTPAPRPTDDVHQTQELIAMHDFATNPGCDPAVPTSDVRQETQFITLHVTKNVQSIRKNDWFIDFLA